MHLLVQFLPVMFQVSDKRVSRNHAIVEINSDGKLVITPVSIIV